MTEMKITIDYPPRFARRYGGERPPAFFIERIFAARLDAQRAFLKTISRYRDQLDAIPLYDAEESLEPRWRQPWFHALDGMSLYAMIASKKPARFLEIGSGNSTKFAARAVRDHELATEITSIDPMPRSEIDALAQNVIRARVEDLSLSVFEAIGPGDVVLFDGSHRTWQNSDVTAFFIDILPMLPAGTTVGVHDVFWPFDYPENWIARVYNEQYVLGAYLLAFGVDFPLIFGCAYMAETYRAEVLDAVSPALIERLTKEHEHLRGQTLWFEKPAVPL